METARPSTQQGGSALLQGSGESPMEDSGFSLFPRSGKLDRMTLIDNFARFSSPGSQDTHSSPGQMSDKDGEKIAESRRTSLPSVTPRGRTRRQSSFMSASGGPSLSRQGTFRVDSPGGAPLSSRQKHSPLFVHHPSAHGGPPQESLREENAGESTRHSVGGTPKTLKRRFGRSSAQKTTTAALSDRMKRLVDRAVREARHVRERMQWKRVFEAMFADDREFLERAFARCDGDWDGLLTGDELFPCLKEVGLSGFKAEERNAIRALCDEWIMTYGEIDVIAFAAGLLPVARHTIAEARSQELLRRYCKHAAKDAGVDSATGEMTITSARCAEIARDMGLDARHMFRSYQDDPGVPFEDFREIVVRAYEASERLLRDRERGLADKMDLDEQCFQKHRSDLMWLHAIFSQYDTDDSGKLDQGEVLRALKEFGVYPKTVEEGLALQKMFYQTDEDGDAQYDFKEFLEIVEQIRSRDRMIRADGQKQLFKRLDKDGSGALSIPEIAPLLDQLGMAPRNRVEQEELAHIIHSADEDGSQVIDFDEFQIFCQRVRERLDRLRFEDEIEDAMKMDFTMPQLRDMRWVFDSLDEDSSGVLRAEELQSCLEMLGKRVKRSEFELIFKELDDDGSGELDFKEFLDFMRIMRDKEGIFSDGTEPINRKAKSLDTHILRRVLEHMRLAKSYTLALTHDELVDLFCSYFQIHQNSNVQERLGIRTVEELYSMARLRDVAMQSGG